MFLAGTLDAFARIAGTACPNSQAASQTLSKSISQRLGDATAMDKALLRKQRLRRKAHGLGQSPHSTTTDATAREAP
jgi:hypothetical protein